MSSHYETMQAQFAEVCAYGPGDEIGEDEVMTGNYALGLDLPDGGVFFIGTVEEIVLLGERISTQIEVIETMAAKPLEIGDFVPDEDGVFQCPRCTDVQEFNPPDYPDLGHLVADVRNHIRDAHPVSS